MSELDTLGKRLKYARKKKGIQQKFAAEKIGVSPQTLSGYESDYREPPFEALKILTDLYEVEVDWLLGVTSTETNSTTSIPDLTLEQLIEAAKAGVPIKPGAGPLSGKDLDDFVTMMEMFIKSRDSK